MAKTSGLPMCTLAAALHTSFSSPSTAMFGVHVITSDQIQGCRSIEWIFPSMCTKAQMQDTSERILRGERAKSLSAYDCRFSKPLSSNNKDKTRDEACLNVSAKSGGISL